MSMIKVSYLAYNKEPEKQAKIAAALSLTAKDYSNRELFPEGKVAPQDGYFEAVGNFIPVEELPEVPNDEAASDDDRMKEVFKIYEKVCEDTRVDITIRVLWLFPDSVHEQYVYLGQHSKERQNLHLLQNLSQQLKPFLTEYQVEPDLQNFFAQELFKAAQTLVQELQDYPYPNVDRIG